MTDRDFQKRRVENITVAVQQLAYVIENAMKTGANEKDINNNIVNVITEVHDEGMLLAMDKIK